MLKLFKNIWLGVILILLASGLLLFSDLNRRQGAKKSSKALPRLAVMQWNSTDLLDHTVEGFLDGLRQQGFEHGRTADIRFFNASGDNNTGSLMAVDLVGGSYDLVLTASTLALQAVAKANTAGRVVHVFGAVTDPYGAGVSITGPKPDQHPAHLVGVGTFQPVERAIRIARQMNPRLGKIGVVWNPGESNSEACVIKARLICKDLGIELIEANAGNTSEVPEAIRSILARGSETVWVGGDIVAISSLNAIVSSARASKIPVFTNDPSDTAKGALFGVGASYHDVGVAVGEIAGKILHGSSPKSFGVENLVPEVLTVNEPLAKEFKEWSIPEDIRTQAKSADKSAVVVSQRQPQPGRTYKVGLLYFGPHPIFEMAIESIVTSLRDAGFVEGRNLELQRIHPNNDMSLLPQVAKQLSDQNLDLIIPLSTPCLGAVMANTRNVPIVFGVVSAPLEAGAGRTFDDHLPRVTGAVWTEPSPELFKWLKELSPACRKVGVIYNPSEANSIIGKERARTMLAALGMTLEEFTVSNSSEAAQAIQALLSAQVDAVFGMADNTMVNSFQSLAQACHREHLLLLADDNSLMGSGALLSCGASPTGEGRHTGQMAARVLLGENPASMPFAPSSETETAVDFDAAANLGIALPAAMLKEAGIFHHASARLGRPFRISMVNLVQNPPLEAAEAGVLRGLRESGLNENEDFTLKRYNAQGEIAQIPAILDSAVADSPDLIITVTTPVLIAAANRIKDIPVVFTVASDPVAVGLFKMENRPANIAGVHDDPQMDKLLDMARRHNLAIASVGIIYDPAQPNSLISVDRLRKACLERKLTLCEATASTVSELPAAAQAVIQRGAGAIMLSADNLVCTGFPAIHETAQRAGVPIYVTETDLIKQGADGAIGDNYEEWGAQSGRMSAKVLSGVPTKELPIEPTRMREVFEPVKSPAAVQSRQVPARPWEIRIARYNDAQFSADTFLGIMDGFKKQGLTEGRDFNVRCLNAQGDMTTLTSIMTAIRAEQPDLVMPISTPALQAALRQVGGLPIVFSCVGDGVHAGAGKSESDHLPNVTGVTTRSSFAGMARLIKKSVPKVCAVGTLFSPAEISSEMYREWFAEALLKEGLKLVAIPVTTGSEVSEATRDFYEAGIEAAEVAVKVLRGSSPKDIPFANTRTEIIAINPDLVRKYGIVLPQEYLKRAKTMKGED
ncbi:MAG: ABC transporter substrate-binding protein [Lentisphaerae bacterium]|nr:ABC transporter substrate-binding protein [Lentisphaerota bacterium]